MHWAVPLVLALPKITFSPVDPPVRDLRVTVDDRPVPLEALFRNFSVPPGHHLVRAEGFIDGETYALEEDVTVPDDESVTTIHLNLKKVPSVQNENIACIMQAKTEAEARRCAEPMNEPPRGCRSCSTTAYSSFDASGLLVVAITIAGSRASSCGSRRLRDRDGGRSRTRAARHPRS